MSINRNKVLQAAQRHFRRRNWDRALREYQSLVDDDPTDMRSYLKCADLHVRMGQNDKALTAYKTIADYYGQQDMYEKAIAVYSQAIRLDPDDIALHHAIGECHFRLGRLKDAIRSFHQAQRMYRDAGDFANQRAMLEYMVRVDPEDIGLRIQLAERYTKDGNIDGALECFTFAAHKLEEEGRLDELLQVLERHIFLDPQRFDLRKQAVRIYLDQQENESALKHLQHCFRADAEDMETMELLAQTFERLGRNDKAVLVLQELGPKYQSLGRESDAENLFRRILRLDPANTSAKEALRLFGPDSGVLAERAKTGPMNLRQNTPPPVHDNLQDVEFLDDGVEFLDDDIEFLDDISVPEPAAHAPLSSAPPTRPAAPPPTPERYAPPPPVPGLAPQVQDEDQNLLDLTDDIELIDDLLVTDDLDVLPVEEETSSQNTEISAVLSECDVFLKYGLYDKAAELIQNALNLAPKNILAHEKLLALQQLTGKRSEQYRTLITLAELTQEQALRAYDFLKQALEVAPNPRAVYVRAEALGIDLYGPPPTDGLAEISVAAIQPLTSDDDPPTIHTIPAPDPVGLEEEISFLDDSDLDDLALLDFDDHPIDDLDLDFDDAPRPSSLSGETDSEIVAADELAFDGVHVVEMNLDIDDNMLASADLSALESPPVPPEQGAKSFQDLFEGIEADDLFDDLFGGAAEPVNLGADDSIGEMAEIDFFIQQGLAEEAEEAIETFASQHPNHLGLNKRRNQLQQIRAGMTADPNPFGSRSLSQKFGPDLGNVQSEQKWQDLGSVINSNLELAMAYRDMGMIEEALDEFRQATDDPEAAISAHFHIALCQIDLGHPAEARDTLHHLLTLEGLTSEVRQAAQQKLAELNAQAS